MRSARSLSLLASVTVALFLAGGLAVRVGADEDSFHQVVVFSEVLSLVADNYVDPLEPQRLLHGAYEGLMSGLDARGAYLTAAELTEWKAYKAGETAGPGISVLLSGRALQIVAVAPRSPAAEAGLEVGDQVRVLDGHSVRELSLDQAWRLLHGPVGSRVRLDVLDAGEGYRRQAHDLLRSRLAGRPYELRVERGIGVLRFTDVAAVPAGELARELDEVAGRSVDTLLLDLRNLVDLDPRAIAEVAALFSTGTVLQLRDRGGQVVESITAAGDLETQRWKGSVAALVNGGTAGSGEALARLVQKELKGLVVGESTYGLGAEPALHEMEDGTGLLLSSALWETASGGRWNEDGVAPDEVVHGKGSDYAARIADQLDQALTLLVRRRAADEVAREAA